MSHIDNRLDVDSAVKHFLQNSDKDDFILYFRHNFKDGEGMLFTNGMNGSDGIPYMPSDTSGYKVIDPEQYDDFRSVLISLTAGLLLQDEELEQSFLTYLKNASR